MGRNRVSNGVVRKLKKGKHSQTGIRRGKFVRGRGRYSNGWLSLSTGGKWIILVKKDLKEMENQGKKSCNL